MRPRRVPEDHSSLWAFAERALSGLDDASLRAVILGDDVPDARADARAELERRRPG